MLKIFKRKKKNINNVSNKNELRNPLFFPNSSCKYCYGEHCYEDKLYITCGCKGTLKWSHKRCLKECIKYQYNDKTECPICKTQYIIPI